MTRSLILLLAGVLALAVVPSASAQIIETKNPSTGERILMSETLRRAEHKIMIRAIGRIGDTRREWALTFRSTDASDDVTVIVKGDAVSPRRIGTDDQVPGGMTTLFFSGETFYEIANAPGNVTLTIGDKTLTLPRQIQDDMQRILNQSASGS
jgi:hypothetical protein